MILSNLSVQTKSKLWTQPEVTLKATTTKKIQVPYWKLEKEKDICLGALVIKNCPVDVDQVSNAELDDWGQ